jgi:hypothetical protein
MYNKLWVYKLATCLILGIFRKTQLHCLLLSGKGWPVNHVGPSHCIFEFTVTSADTLPAPPLRRQGHWLFCPYCSTPTRVYLPWDSIAPSPAALFKRSWYVCVQPRPPGKRDLR